MDFRQEVMMAAGRADVREAVGRVYADVADAIATRQPRCDLSGRCCKFEQYGHRLYVSTLELAAFVAGRENSRPTVGTVGIDAGDQDQPQNQKWAGTGQGCRYQIGKLCSVHQIRPFGCRMFFCDPSADEWQKGLYEQFHGQLKQLHVTLGVGYFYVEWRAGLAAVESIDGI